MFEVFLTLLGAIGIAIWGSGIILSIKILLKSTESAREKFLGMVIVFFISFGTGMFLNIMPLSTPINAITTYSIPSSIIKTNNIVVITHIDGDECIIKGKVFRDTVYWNCTNIMIKTISGKNIYKYKVSSYEIVLDR